jgi:Sigma-70 region 3
MASEGESPAVPDAVQELVDQLVARNESRGDSCVELSELSELIQEADLGDEDAQTVHDLLQERGVDLRDDCGRREVEQTSYVHDDLAERTTDAMSLFLQSQDMPLLDLDELHEARDAARVVTSLDRPVGDSEETPFGALLASDERGPEEEVDYWPAWIATSAPTPKPREGSLPKEISSSTSASAAACDSSLTFPMAWTA